MNEGLNNSLKNKNQASILIRSANKDIQQALYKINKVIDNGNFHKILTIKQKSSFDIFEGVPICCKITVRGIDPPLIFKIAY